MTQVHPANTPPTAKHLAETGRIIQEAVSPFVMRPREKNKAQVKSSSAAEDSSDESKRSKESQRVTELAAAFSNGDDGGGNGEGGGAHHGAEAEIVPPEPPQPDPGLANATQAPVAPAPVPVPVQSAGRSSEEDELAAELATLGEDPGIFELMLPGGAQLGVAIEARGQSLSFFLSTDNDPLGKKLKSKKKELATSLERRIGRTLNLIVL